MLGYNRARVAREHSFVGIFVVGTDEVFLPEVATSREGEREGEGGEGGVV